MIRPYASGLPDSPTTRRPGGPTIQARPALLAPAAVLEACLFSRATEARPGGCSNAWRTPHG